MQFIDFIKNPCKKIIISNNLGDITSVIKNLALDNKMSFSNFEKVSILQLAKSLIYPFKDINYVDHTSNEIIFYAFLMKQKDKKDIYNLIPNTSFTFESANVCLLTINEIRKGKIKGAINIDIKLLIDEYEKHLKEHDYYDDILLIKEALKEINKLGDDKIKQVLKVDDSSIFAVLDTSLNKLTYLEKLFLDTLMDKLGIKYEILTAFKENKNVNISSYSAYGFYQEVENIINTIDKNKLPIEDVEIIISDDMYTNIIKAYFDNYHIPYYFDYGTSLKCFDVYGLIASIIEFHQNHYSIKSLYDIYRNAALLDEYKCIKELKNLHADINFIRHYSTNNKIDDKKKMFIYDLLDLDKYKKIDELYERIVQFIYKYTDKESYASLHEVLEKQKKVFSLYVSLNILDNPFDVILKTLDNVKVDDEIKDITSIRIRKLTNINYLFKKHVFILGLSSSKLHLKEIESPLVSDEEFIKTINTEDYYVELATLMNVRYNEKLNYLIKHNRCAHIYLSYSKYDSNEFKHLSPSIFYLNNLKEELSPLVNPLLTLDYKLEDKREKIIDDLSFNKAKSRLKFSPSSLNTLYKCPLNYIYSKSLTETMCDEYDNTWLMVNEKGTLMHAILETYYNKHIDRDYDASDLNNIIDALVKQEKENHPFDNKEEMDIEIINIIKAVKRYIKNNRRKDEYKVLGCEIYFEDVKVRLNDKDYLFNGYIDRVDYAHIDGTDSLSIKIYDYKSGSEKTLEEDGLTQAFIYQEAVKEHLKKDEVRAKIGDFDITKVTYDFAYVYLNRYDSTKFVTNEDVIKIKQTNEEKLKQFDELDNSVDSFFSLFNPKTKKEDSYTRSRCEYCNFKSICSLKKRLSMNTIWEKK